MEYLKSSELVAQIQKHFGVHIHELEKSSGNVTPSQTNISGQNKGYIIKNYFWYYLFVFGTELGDELFYSMFIPFWFWNVDGAVGRRVILVWAIVMCTGKHIF